MRLCMMPELANMAAHASSIATVPTNITTSKTKSSSAAPTKMELINEKEKQRKETRATTVKGN